MTSDKRRRASGAATNVGDRSVHVRCANPGSVYPWRELVDVLGVVSSPHPVRVDFIRHGESVSNANGLIAGAWDVPLTAKGRFQAKILGLRLDAAYDLAWSSRLKRSQETLGLALKTRRGLCEFVCTDSRLNERSMGVLERTPRRTIEAYLDGDLRYAPEGGESYLQLTQRVLSFLVDLVLLGARSTVPLRALVSTHVGPMRIIRGILERRRDRREVLKQSFENAEPYACELRELKWPRFLAREEVLYVDSSAAGLLAPDDAAIRQELSAIRCPPD